MAAAPLPSDDPGGDHTDGGRRPPRSAWAPVAEGALRRADQSERREVVAELARRLGPVTRADERLVPLPGPLASLCPRGGFGRGWSLGVEGAGARSLACAVVAGALGADGWAAVVGAGELGWIAAEEAGLRLDRVIVVEPPPRGESAAVLAALLGAVEVIVVGDTAMVGPRDARRLQSRAREQETTLVHLGRGWPGSHDLRLVARTEAWEGLGDGHGHLRRRRLSVEAAGRRAGVRPAAVSVWLPGPDGSLSAVESSSTAESSSGSTTRSARSTRSSFAVAG